MYWTDLYQILGSVHLWVGMINPPSILQSLKGCCCGDQFLLRDAMRSAVYAVVVCLSGCLSVTLRYCIKTAKCRITQTTAHDSPMTLVF